MWIFYSISVGLFLSLFHFVFFSVFFCCAPCAAMTTSKLAVTGLAYRLAVIQVALRPVRMTVQYSYGISMGSWKARSRKIRKCYDLQFSLRCSSLFLTMFYIYIYILCMCMLRIGRLRCKICCFHSLLDFTLDICKSYTHNRCNVPTTSIRFHGVAVFFFSFRFAVCRPVEMNG